MGYEAKKVKQVKLTYKQVTGIGLVGGDDTVFWTPANGKKIYLRGLHLWPKANLSIIIYSIVDSTKTTIIKTYGVSNVPFSIDLGGEIDFPVGHALGITVTGSSANVEVNAFGHEK